MTKKERREPAFARGLFVTFTVITWASIGPPLFIAMVLASWFAVTELQVTLQQALPTLAMGLVFLGAASIPGTLIWRRQFRKSIIAPLQDLSALMN